VRGGGGGESERASERESESERARDAILYMGITCVLSPSGYAGETPA